MDKDGFRRSLENDKNIISKVKAVSSRISKAACVETIFSINLDNVVKDDSLMENLLERIKGIDINGAKGNAVRKYYEFKNGRKF